MEFLPRALINMTKVISYNTILYMHESDVALHGLHSLLEIAIAFQIPRQNLDSWGDMHACMTKYS